MDKSHSQPSYSNIHELPPWRFSQVALAFLAGFVITPLMVSLFMGAILPMLSLTSRLGVAQLASYAVWLLIIWHFKERYGPSVWTHLGLHPEKPWHSYLYNGLLCTGLILTIGWILGMLSTVFHWPQQQPYQIFPRDILRIISFFAVVISPVVEEITFRGLLQPTLYRYMNPVMALLLTAALFTSFHSLYYGNWLALAYVGLMGLVLGSFRYHTRSTYPCIIGHLFNNLMAAIVVLQ